MRNTKLERGLRLEALYQEGGRGKWQVLKVLDSASQLSPNHRDGSDNCETPPANRRSRP